MNFQQRRMAVMDSLPPQSLAVFFSGRAPVRSADENYPFSVNRNFAYLTGLDGEQMALVLIKTETSVQSVLFQPMPDPDLARWVGGRMEPEHSRAIAKVNRVLPQERLESFLYRQMKLFSSSQPVKVGLDLSCEGWYQQVDPAYQFARQLSERYPAAQVCDLHRTLAQLRMIKTEEEIERIRQAAEATITAVKVMMRHCAEGISETELEGVFDFALMKQGIREHAFPTICASAHHATVLHYSDNNAIIEPGSLVLCDLGAAVDHYCADITRTFPASGRFTARQKEIYDIVLQGQRKVIEAIRPGVTLGQLNQVLVNWYQQALPPTGLLDNGKTVGDYYYHSVSHHLGLDAHDASVAGTALQPGMVITVEPGLYVKQEGIGIRIEDDLLVTQDGSQNLTAGLMRTTEEIEAFMNKGEQYHG